MRIRNKVIREIAKVTPTEDKMRETRLRWFGHVKRKSVDVLVRKCEKISTLAGRRDRAWPKKCLGKVIREDLKVVRLK